MSLLGKIGGPMLKDNLERNGVDLTVQSGLVYFDVNNLRIGINNSFPVVELDIVGDALFDSNLKISGTTITSENTNGNITIDPNGTGTLRVPYLNNNSVLLAGASGTVTQSSNITFASDTLTVVSSNIGDLRLANNTIISTTTNGNIALSPNGTGVVVAARLASSDLTQNRVVIAGANGRLTDSPNLTFDGSNLVINGDTLLSSAQLGNITFSNTTISTSLTNSNLTLDANGSGNVVIDSAKIVGTSVNSVLITSSSNLVTTDNELRYNASTNTLSIGNIDIADNDIEAVNSNGNLSLTTNGSGAILLNSTSTLLLPAGTSGERPSIASPGMIRWNTTNTELEYYNGSSWDTITTNITSVTSDTFNGDGSTLAFTLSQSATTAGVIVSINGVLQKPTTAYTVSGTTLTFTEAPLSTDNIEARTVVTAVSVTSIADGDTTVQVNDSTPNIIATVNGSTVLTLNSATATFVGNIIGTGSLASIVNTTPANSSATGIKGQIAYDSSYIYVCVATNTWVRFAITTSF